MSNESDGLWRRDEPQSPCVKLCMIEPATGWCAGCQRTLDEIAAWSRLTPDARADVLADLPRRAAEAAERRRADRPSARRGREGARRRAPKERG